MSDECIHGFEAGLCAACYPKPVAEAPVAVGATTRTRTAGTRAPRASTPAVRRTPGRAASLPFDDIREQRIYHLTHIDNLAGILSDGEITPDATPKVELSPAGAREERRSAEVGLDATLAEFVPFFLSANATLWQSVRAGEPHPRVARELAGHDAAEFVLLVSTVRQLGITEQPWALADGNAAGSTTRLATTSDDAERMLRKLRSEGVDGGIVDAELLVKGAFPLESISLVGVAHDKARARVRDILADADFEVKVAVYPPWFASE